MNAEQAKKLRAPFKPTQIGQLPKPTKKENPKGKCQECGGWHGLPAVHLDYVGHAATTDRFLEVDPVWTWEPMARGDHGEPLIINGGLWINLTICGVTRPGFGDATGSGGMKEMIGDALRNAGMRFGVGLDLWAKEDLHATESSAGTGELTPQQQPKEATNGSAAVADGTVKFASEAQRKRLFAITKAENVETARLREILLAVTGQESTAQIPASLYDKVIEAVQLEAVPFS